jgi:hypothetical protein
VYIFSLKHTVLSAFVFGKLVVGHGIIVDAFSPSSSTPFLQAVTKQFADVVLIVHA